MASMSSRSPRSGNTLPARLGRFCGRIAAYLYRYRERQKIKERLAKIRSAR